MSFKYLTNCINCPGPDPGQAIRDLVDSADPITRRTFLKHVDRDDLRRLEKELSYADHPARGLTMAKDWHVGYWKGFFRGEPCYFFDHSRIEYIFTKGGR